MIAKIRRLWGEMRMMQTARLEPAIREALTREEESGAKALLYFRTALFFVFVLAGVTAPSALKDILTNLAFSFAYAIIVTMQWYLQHQNLHRAMHRFNYFLVVADHALFAGLLLFYFSTYSPDNFNHAMKSPYVVLLLIPTLTTMVQFRHTLVFFSAAVLVFVVLCFFGYALLSGAPATTSWTHYILGDALIYPAWLGLWLLLPLIVTTLVAYAIFRSIRMVMAIGKIEGERRQLSRYFSPSVVEEITANGDAGLSLAGSERREVAVLFADIRSFTTLSENMAPGEVAAMLSELRQIQMQAVFEHNGMVDKFIGDAIMAVFGAPRSAGTFAQDVQNACASGLAMRAALARFNGKREAEGKMPIRIGIGIHAGEVFAGNLGGEGLLEYTVIGDVVNTASRIEHLCKKAQADFLISETVARLAAENLQHTKIGLVKIRGREQPLAIHKVQGT
jgi:adenylate cyclase